MIKLPIYIIITTLFFLGCSSPQKIIKPSDKKEKKDFYPKKDSTLTTIFNDFQNLNTKNNEFDFNAFNDPASGFWSVEFYNLDADTIILRHNNRRKLLPASNLKLITSATALKILGKDFRFKTNYYFDGIIDTLTNRMVGNIIVDGSGDPTIGTNYFRDTTVFQFDTLSQILKTRFNVEHIIGNIIIKNKTKADKWYGKGWDIDDTPKYYAPIISNTAFNENLIKIIIQKGKIKIIPFYPFIFKLDTIDTQKTKFSRILGTDSVVIRSNFKGTSRGFVTVQNPEKLFALQLVKRLRDNDISFSYLNTDVEGEFQEIATLHSKSMKYMLHKCNTESNNFYAEELFRKIAEVYLANGDSTSKNLSLKEIIHTNKLIYESLYGISGITLADGSGLSRRNFVSANMIIKVLRMALKQDFFDEYIASLSKPGYDGTLKWKFLSKFLIGNLFAKTGSMTGVNNTSGYLITKKGTRVAFSILNNYYTHFRGTMNRKLKNMLNNVYMNY